MDSLFLIQTETNGFCTAKPLRFYEGNDKMPSVEMKNASKELSKDVWIMEQNPDQNKEENSEKKSEKESSSSSSENDAATEVSIHSICKSSTDDFLLCEALDCTDFDDNDAIKTLK